jgi:hypothetical protein
MQKKFKRKILAMLLANNNGGVVRQQLLDGAPLYIAPYTAIPVRGAVTPSFTRAGVKNLLDFERRE